MSYVAYVQVNVYCLITYFIHTTDPSQDSRCKPSLSVVIDYIQQQRKQAAQAIKKIQGQGHVNQLEFH